MSGAQEKPLQDVDGLEEAEKTGIGEEFFCSSECTGSLRFER